MNPSASAEPTSAEAARALALGLLEGGTLGPGDDVLAVAWALKDACYEAWSSEPARAARAGDVLASLLRQPVPPEQWSAIAGLAAWTGGIAQVTRGQMADAVESFDSAATSLRAAGLPDPAAQTQVPKIMALSMLGHHDQATACAEATQRELRALGNLRAAARVSQNLGSLQLRRDAYAEAARHYREAAVLFARLRDHEHSVMADIGLADTFTSMGDFDEALRIYARARMRAGNQGLEMLQALVDESVALVELARGQYQAALAGFESARRRYQAQGVPQYLAIAEKQLADAYLELRLLPEALALLGLAVAQFHELGLPDEQAWALTQRGRAEALLGRPGAQASFAEAASLFAEQANAVGSAAVALAQAELALSQGQPHAALGWAEQAAQGFEGASQADGRARADVLRAQALLQAGQLRQASAAFDQTLQRARSLQQGAVQVRCLTGQGLVALAQSDKAAAHACFEAAIELFEDQRHALPGDEIRSAFLTDHLRPYQEVLRMTLAEGDGAAVLQQLERFRARALDERLAGVDTADLAPEVPALRERLNWLYRRVQRLQDESGSSATLSEEMVRTERELLEHARRLRLAAPARAAGLASTLDVQALQRALQPGDTLVEYGVLDDELFACVVRPDAVQLLRNIAAWPEVLQALRASRFQLDSLRHGSASLHQHLDRLTGRAQLRLQQLHALMWAPLASALAGSRRLLLVPHAQLGALPFAALPDQGQTLGQRYQLALAPSARVAWRGLQTAPRPPRRAVAIGESSRLPHAATEATQVAALFPQGQAFVGEQATLLALQQHAGGADVLHLACHGQFRSDNPRFSALHLLDGALTVEQAEALKLGPATVVLSACETALSALDTGDEMVGLVRAFLVAGAARVVAALWPVDDAVTAAFMSEFYRALIAGAQPAAALQQAQAAVMAKHPHPAFWAAFALYGGW